MAKIRILATEDDPIHEAKLRMALEVLGYELIEVLSDPQQVLSLIKATKPDILLMDIDLGADISGIDLVKKINETHDIPSVFLTSFTDNETFQEAKKTNPLAYITKPYEIPELQRAIELAVYSKKNKAVSFSGWKNDVVLRDHIFIKEGSSLTKVLISDIKLIEAYDKYCFIYTSAKKFMLKARLKNIITQLPADLFCQVHRSYVVNMTAIENIELQQNKLFVLGKELNISKTYKEDLFSRINSLG